MQLRPPSLDTDADCPVPLETLSRIFRCSPDALPDLLVGIPERTRAELAVYLYGRSHTHELGLSIAAACDQLALKRAAHGLGEAIYAQSRRNFEPPTYGLDTSRAARRRVSLAGSRVVGGIAA